MLAGSEVSLMKSASWIITTVPSLWSLTASAQIIAENPLKLPICRTEWLSALLCFPTVLRNQPRFTLRDFANQRWVCAFLRHQSYNWVWEEWTTHTWLRDIRWPCSLFCDIRACQSRICWGNFNELFIAYWVTLSSIIPRCVRLFFILHMMVVDIITGQSQLPY